MGNSLKIATTMGYYMVFTKNFIERYCQNKDRPELNCDGKCYLAKMLKQENNDDTPPVNVEMLRSELLFFFSPNTSWDVENPIAKSNNPWKYLNLYKFSLIEKIIHPPQAI